MAEKTLNNIRIVNKHDTEANWLKATGFIPKKGELIVYDKDSTYNYERFKIGDGSTVVSSLPFADANKVDKVAGKGLSTNDYTTAEKNKLSGIAEGANKTVVDDKLNDTSTNPVQNKVVHSAINTILGMIGDESVEEQIKSLVASDLGIYVSATEPEQSSVGDIWIDTANDPEYTAPVIPEVTQADNGKVLMVVNGKYQLVSLNLSIDANGVVSM